MTLLELSYKLNNLSEKERADLLLFLVSNILNIPSERDLKEVSRKFNGDGEPCYPYMAGFLRASADRLVRNCKETLKLEEDLKDGTK